MLLDLFDDFTGGDRHSLAKSLLGEGGLHSTIWQLSPVTQGMPSFAELSVTLVNVPLVVAAPVVTGL